MHWMPRVVYDSTTLNFTIAQRPWTPRTERVGGRDISATGVPAAYSVRRDELWEITLRFWESEWEAVHAWLTWAQEQGTFDWYPDQNEAESHEVYLHTPAMGEPIAPVRDESFPHAYELTVTLRRVGVDAQPFTTVYHPA